MNEKIEKIEKKIREYLYELPPKKRESATARIVKYMEEEIEKELQFERTSERIRNYQ